MAAGVDSGTAVVGGVAGSDVDTWAAGVLLTTGSDGVVGEAGGGAEVVGAGGDGSAPDEVGATEGVRDVVDALPEVDGEALCEVVDVALPEAEELDRFPEGGRYCPETGPQKALCGRTSRRARGAAGSRALHPCAA